MKIKGGKKAMAETIHSGYAVELWQDGKKIDWCISTKIGYDCHNTKSLAEATRIADALIANFQESENEKAIFEKQGWVN